MLRHLPSGYAHSVAWLIVETSNTQNDKKRESIFDIKSKIDCEVKQPVSGRGISVVCNDDQWLRTSGSTDKRRQ